MYKLAILLLTVGSAAHAADDCRPVMDAAKKTATTPNHLFLTHVAAFRNGGKPTSSEVVTTKDRCYVLVNGKWTSRPYDVAKEASDIDAAESQPTCKFVRDETVDGEAASVYGEKSEDTTTTVWISKRSGLLLRMETDIDVGGAHGKDHSESRFDYVHIEPPAA